MATRRLDRAGNSGRHWLLTATRLLSIGQIVWILIEWAYVGMSPLIVVYGIAGIAAATLPASAAVRRDLTRP